jgi:UTP--glucose-1-phosphate uridylyltransferase
MSRIRKAVIPAAGLGTRFLPATKSIPKEMLPLVDKPILMYVVEEAVRAGAEQIVLVQGRGKGAIEDFFDTSFELETVLEKSGKQDLLSELRRIKDMADVISIRQKEARGLGHAVYAARPVVGDEPFALLLGDEIMIDKPGQPSAIKQLADVYGSHAMSTVAVIEVPKEDVKKYGIIKGHDHAGSSKSGAPLIRVEDVIEKPDPASAPSRWALPGRYVFSAAIFKYLENAKPGKNGEIQLTDSMTQLARFEGLLATTVNARRYDAGDKFGYLQANLELALDRPDLGRELRPYLKNLVAGFKETL